MTQQVDIAELLVRRAGKRLGDAYARFWEQTSPNLQEFDQKHLREKEAEACIETVLMFQAGMEAMINEEISTNKELIGVRKEREYLQKRLKDMSFKNKWEQSYQALEIEDTSQHLEQYLEFYRHFRVPITHPKNRYFDISEYTFPKIYHGIRSGWLAYMAFSTNWEPEAREDSWEQFCEENNVPGKLETT